MSCFKNIRKTHYLHIYHFTSDLILDANAKNFLHEELLTIVWKRNIFRVSKQSLKVCVYECTFVNKNISETKSTFIRFTPTNVFQFYIVCTVHCNKIILCKPTDYIFCNFMFWFLIFWCLLLVSNPRVQFQESGCIYRYGMVWYSVFYMHKQFCRFTAFTDACKTYNTITVYTTVFQKINPRFRNILKTPEH